MGRVKNLLQFRMIPRASLKSLNSCARNLVVFGCVTMAVEFFRKIIHVTTSLFITQKLRLEDSVVFNCFVFLWPRICQVMKIDLQILLATMLAETLLPLLSKTQTYRCERITRFVAFRNSYFPETVHYQVILNFNGNLPFFLV